MSKINVGLAGAGFGWSVLRPALERSGHFQVTSVWSRSIKRRKELSRSRPSVSVAPNWESLVKDFRTQAVALALPPKIQEKVAARAALAGKALFLEKPFAADLGGARKLAKILREKKSSLVVDFEFRELPLWQEAKKLVLEKVLGPLTHVDVMWYAPAPVIAGRSWKDHSSMGGGLLLNFGSHVADYLEYFLGPLSGLHTTMNSSNLISFKFKSRRGTGGRVHISRKPGLQPRHEILLSGKNGFLLLRNHSRDYMNGFRLEGVTKNGDVIQRSDSPRLPNEDGRIDAICRMAKIFHQEIKRPSFNYLNRALRSHLILDAVKKSHSLSREVQLGA